MYARYLVGGTAVAVGTFGLIGRRLSSPAAGSGGPNRVYLPVRNEQEFAPLALLGGPLLANFTFRNDPKSTKLTGVLHRIVESTSASVSLVDVEADEPGVRDLLVRYNVASIPTVVAIKGGQPMAYYSPKEIEWDDVDKWVESVGAK